MKLRLLLGAMLLTSITLFFLPTPPSNLDFIPNKPTYTANIPEVFGSAYFDLFPHHSQFLDFITELQNESLIDNSPKTLVLVDYHSDMYVNNEHLDRGFEGVGNWVNVLISKGNIDEIYWIIPDSTQNEPQKNIFWQRQSITTERAYIDGPLDLTIYVSKEGRLSFDKPQSSDDKKVLLHKTLLKDLPPIPQKQVLLTIDADFFAYNGFEADQYNFTPQTITPTQLEQDFSSLITALQLKGIKPIVVGCSLSPRYVQDEHKQDIEKFFRFLSLFSKTGTDFLSGYQHNNTTSGRFTHQFTTTNQARSAITNGHTLFDLETADLLSDTPNGQVTTSTRNPELDLGIKLIRFHQKKSLLQTWTKLMLLSTQTNTKEKAIILEKYF